MTTTNKRLSGPALLATTAATIYTAPAGGAQIRRIRLNAGPNARTFTMSIGANAAATELYTAYPVAGGGVGADIYGPFNLNGGDIVQALASNTDVVCELDGVEFS